MVVDIVFIFSKKTPSSFLLIIFDLTSAIKISFETKAALASPANGRAHCSLLRVCSFYHLFTFLINR